MGAMGFGVAGLDAGAMDRDGTPLGFSNWGDVYRSQGVLAPGEDVVAAEAGGGTVARTGTSFATAIVSGVAGLIMSLQLAHGGQPDADQIRSAILDSAIGSGADMREDPSLDPLADGCRLLAGRLNVQGAVQKILSSTQGDLTMPDTGQVQGNDPTLAAATGVIDPPGPSDPPAYREPSFERVEAVVAASERAVGASSCGCGCKGGASAPQLVFALGQLGFDFGTQARRDSILQHMAEPSGGDPAKLLAYLQNNPWDAASILWTLHLDATPIYVIRGAGPFAAHVYARLQQFLREQITEGVERVSVPGWIVGQAQLLSGQMVPVIRPELRGMYSWSTAALIEAACGADGGGARGTGAAKRRVGARAGKGAPIADHAPEAVASFLERVYFALRNLGVRPQDRALNYAAANAFQAAGVCLEAVKQQMQLDTIEVEPSAICRPGSECWDVVATFFNPAKVLEQARRVYRFTVDVSDVVPVMAGEVRSWSVR